MAAPTRTLLIYCYSREGRGFASRALKQAGIRFSAASDYYSAAAMEGDTPRYIVHDVPQSKYAAFDRAVTALNAHGIEVYYDE